MSICTKCGADSEHLNDVGVCPSEFNGGWIDNVKEGDRFRISRPVPAEWLERKAPTSTLPSYTLKEIEALAREWVGDESGEGYRLRESLVLSLFVQWLARREREGRDEWYL